MARTERESNKRNEVADLLVLPRPKLTDWRRLQQKNLCILGLLKRKEWLQCHRENSWQIRQSRLCLKKKKQNCLSKVPDREVGESQGEREPHLGEKEGNQNGSMNSKGVDSTVKEGRFQEGEGGKVRRAFLEESMSG